MNTSKKRIILIAGPTASGKSALAFDLAKAIGGSVINADAMQVYRGLPVLTAQPGIKTRKEIQHFLYEIADPAEHFSAGKWLAAASAEIERQWKNEAIPLLTGGSGMYFQSILRGMANISPIPESVRNAVQNEMTRFGSSHIRQRLAELDPDAAVRIKAGDKQRLARALEIILATGKTQKEWQKEASPAFLTGANVTAILLQPPRRALYQACDQRFTSMMDNGAAEEVRTLLERQLSPTLPAMKIIGLREIAAFLTGALDKSEATARAQQATRNYAKRQVTWFKNQWLDKEKTPCRSLLLIEDFYRPALLNRIVSDI